ncbi:acyl-CoA dehydrogenase family protein [Nonomuraea ferruginea]
MEGGWTLTGQKIWTSLAQYAHWGICLARTSPGKPKHEGITYFLVDMAAPGVTVRPLKEINGDELFNEVFLDDVFVPDEQVVGEVDGGWRVARDTLSHERVALGDSWGAGVEAHGHGRVRRPAAATGGAARAGGPAVGRGAGHLRPRPARDPRPARHRHQRRHGERGRHQQQRR